jgi:hypothetical protein
MNDNTILRIKVPAHLYESVKKSLTLKEAKQNFGMPGSTTIKEKKAPKGDKPKKAATPKSDSSPKKTAPKKAMTPKKEEAKGEMKKEAGKKEYSLEELNMYKEMLDNRIAKLQEGEKNEK